MLLSKARSDELADLYSIDVDSFILNALERFKINKKKH